MLRLIDIDPDPSSMLMAQLLRWQADVDAGKTYAEQVAPPSDELHEVSRPKGVPPLTPPPAGEMVFVNPRKDDPLHFFKLDLRGTFRLVASPGLTGRDRARADYTLKVLPLNDDALCWERRNEYGNYLARLTAYVRARRSEPPSSLTQRRQALLRLRHPTVWQEMLRQQHQIAALARLFDAAPEARGWHHCSAR